MRSTAQLVAISLLLPTSVPTVAAAEDAWQLMSRHGGCFPIRSLERKLSDIGNISDPDAFVEFVRAKGLDASARTISFQGENSVEVLIPSKELSLLFVRPEVCPQAKK